MSIVLVGSTSGSITLQEPAVAGTTVLDLPAVSGTIALTSQTQTFMVVSYEVGSTTDGGTATGGSFQTRPLNTINYNGITGASLASNAVTLPAGNYLVNACASAFLVNQFRLRIRNTTASTNLVLGILNEAAGIENNGYLSGQFTLSGTSTIELQMYCQTTRGGDGMGTNGGSGGVNAVYAVMQLIKF
jgi:hypothetical protein